ncbi:MAG: SPOR domain-containing protein [Bacilli bacterium]|nr:SPOR domain-containing protein [Bacilli bacterium]MDD4077544.1 SPOR domain-containing protein [Bacilli bacterium]MDD4388589.1 SPOR domain-containing protein [Bacilli bacterium]
MIKKREIDIFGVLLGIVIGCIIGFFLSTRININPPNNNNDDDTTGAIYGNVYLLQIGKVNKAEDAYNLIENIKAQDLHSVYVNVGDNYYVYGGIADSEAALAAKKSSFEYKGFTPVIKKEYILDKPNTVIDNSTEYEFWRECVTNLLNNLGGKTYVVTDQFHANPVCLEIYTLIVALKSVQNENMRDEIRLNIYQEIIKNLN